MNFSDSEVVASILKDKGYELTNNSKEASLVLLNTCSIRDKAEQTVRNKLKNFNSLKKENSSLKVGVLGCMAERLKEKFLKEEKIVDIPNADIKKETYMGFRVYLNIPFVIIFFVGIKGAGDSLLE